MPVHDISEEQSKSEKGESYALKDEDKFQSGKCCLLKSGCARKIYFTHTLRFGRIMCPTKQDKINLGYY